MTRATAKSASSPTVLLPIKDLLPRVALAKNFIADREIIPVLKHLFLHKDEVHAFSGDAGCVLYTSHELGPPASLLAVQLLRVLQSLHDQGTEVLEFQRHVDHVDVRGGRFKARLALALVDDETPFQFCYPPKTSDASPLDGAFWADVSKAELTVSKDASAHHFLGVYWSERGWLLSSDNHRITIVRPKDATQTGPKGGVLIPKHFLDRLGSSRLDVQTLIVERESRLWALCPYGALYTAMLHDRFPFAPLSGLIAQQYQRIKAKTGVWVRVQAPLADLTYSLARLMIFLEGQHLPQMRLTLDGSTMTLRVVGEDSATLAEEVFEIAPVGDAREYVVNAKYFREAFELCEHTEFWVGDVLAPLYFQSADRRTDHLLVPLPQAPIAPAP